jgi:hypothetical protein
MTPQDKAQEIKESFNNSLTVKDCSLVAVDQIIEALSNKTWSLVAVDQIIEALSHKTWENRNELMFYLEVKKELKKL